MIIYLIILLVLIVWKGKLTSWNPEYHGKDETAAVKGLFIIIVFLSHLRSYVTGTDPTAIVYNAFFDKIGQLMVTMFFFYSGYGCFFSWMRKKDYTKGFLRNRVLKTLLHFDLAVLLYVVLNFALGIEHSPKEYVLCWIGWESIGNSNWYIFVILVAYILSYIGFVIPKIKGKLGRLLVITGLTAAAIVLLKVMGKEPWWYNTVICYPLGAAFAMYREPIEAKMQKTAVWIASFFGIGFVFCVSYLLGGVFYQLSVMSFCCIVVLLTMKFEINNKALIWCGKHLFEIYILQRIPMILLTHYVTGNAVLITGVTLIITLLMAKGFEMFMRKMDALVFKHKV